jgi:hypothetical protein
MRIVSLVAFALLAASPANAAPGPMQLERVVWKSLKDRDLGTFERYLAPNYVGHYSSGLRNRAEELAIVRGMTFDSYEISNMTSRTIDPGEDVMVTYSVVTSGRMGARTFSGKWWVASLWHRSGGKWQRVYHTGIQAETAQPR